MSETLGKFDIDQRPVSADSSVCRFSAGKVKFEKSEGDSLKHPITMLARSDQPIDHWWWGRIVHDIDGIKFHKESIVIDYCHDDREILGYLDEQRNDKGLWCSGCLIRKEGSKADEVITNAENDVPYEASIFFDPDTGLVLEHVSQGASSQVNGFTVEGPDHDCS